MKRKSKRGVGMNRRWLLALVVGAVGVLVALALIVHFAGRVDQPVAQGRPLLAWAADLSSPDPKTQASAASAVLAIGPRGVPTLIWALDRGDSLVGRAVEGAESRLPARLWRFLYSLIRPHEARRERAAAARALRVLGPAALPAVPALAAALPDHQPEVVTEAVSTLSAVTTNSTGTVEAVLGTSGATALATALPQVGEPTRLPILMALGRMGPAAGVAAPAVTALLGDARNNGLGGEIANTLQKIGEDSLPPLLDLLSSRDVALKVRVRTALMAVIQDSSQRFIQLQDAFPKQPTAVRLELIQLFAESPTSFRRSAAAIARGLDDSDADIRQYAETWIRGQRESDLRLWFQHEGTQLRDRVLELKASAPPAAPAGTTPR